MRDILEEAQSVVEKLDYKQMCERCPWNKFCIELPKMTTEEIEKQIAEEPPADVKARDDKLAYKLLTTVVLAGQDTSCRACPVFVSRLREGPKLSQEIRRLMQEWEP